MNAFFYSTNLIIRVVFILEFKKNIINVISTISKFDS